MIGTGVRIGVETGIGGGTRVGADPEDSGFVTKKNSSLDPILACKRDKTT